MHGSLGSSASLLQISNVPFLVRSESLRLIISFPWQLWWLYFAFVFVFARSFSTFVFHVLYHFILSLPSVLSLIIPTSILFNKKNPLVEDLSILRLKPWLRNRYAC